MNLRLCFPIFLCHKNHHKHAINYKKLLRITYTQTLAAYKKQFLLQSSYMLMVSYI